MLSTSILFLISCRPDGTKALCEAIKAEKPGGLYVVAEDLHTDGILSLANRLRPLVPLMTSAARSFAPTA